jgi:hypothetical protein
MQSTLWIRAALLLGLAANAAAAPRDDGAARDADGGFEVFDAARGAWVGPEDFWTSFAGRGGGQDWGRGSAYPPYAEVGEFDTFRVEIDGQSCLMQFFHQRWRRANDVQRWNERFNGHGACPRVFD